MPIAITDDQRALADSVSQVLRRRDARADARALLEAPEEKPPAAWRELVEMGVLGLHIPEEYGGSGGDLTDLVVAVEELGRAVTPGAFVPTVVASAVLAADADDATRKTHLPGLADGSRTAAFALDAEVELRDGTASGTVPVALGAGTAELLLVSVGDDVVLVDVNGGGVTINVPANLDPTRRSARVTLDGAAVTTLAGSGTTLRDLSRVILSAEAVGLARGATEMAADYAKVREQFGRVIAMFQAVKHHCANMAVATEVATATTWDAARGAAVGGDQRALTAAVAATVAGEAAYLCANLNQQVHGGIGMTWEHDAHLYLRRATVLRALLDGDAAAEDATNLVRRGVKRERTVDLPPEAEAMRGEVREFVERGKGLDAAGRRDAMIETGYAMPHWPKPWGRDANAVEQLVIEQEFAAAGIKRPSYGITGWNLLTVIQHATPEQVQRLRPPALRPGALWGLPFSQPPRPAGAPPRAHLVSAVPRPRRRLGRRGHQDPRHPHRGRVARQRPEGVDQRRARGRQGLRDSAHRSGRPEAPGHHDDDHRHACKGRRGPPAAADLRRVRLQRGLLQRRLRPGRGRHRPRQRRLDRGTGHSRQREREHRRR